MLKFNISGIFICEEWNSVCLHMWAEERDLRSFAVEAACLKITFPCHMLFYFDFALLLRLRVVSPREKALVRTGYLSGKRRKTTSQLVTATLPPWADDISASDAARIRGERN